MSRQNSFLPTSQQGHASSLLGAERLCRPQLRPTRIRGTVMVVRTMAKQTGVATKLFCGVLAAALLGPAAAHHCCPDDTPILVEKHSCEGRIGYLRLNCSGRGMYHLDPEKEPDDIFTLKNGELVVGPPGMEYSIDNDSFCLSRLSYNGNVTEHQIAMVCFPEEIQESSRASLRHLLNGICLCISTIFLIVAFLVYIVLPELRDLDDKCLMGYMASLTFAYILLALLQFNGGNYGDVLCVVQAFFLYFWLMSAFFWLSVVSFNIWRRTVWCRLPMQESRLFYVYCGYGYGVPLIFLFVAITADHIEGDHIKPSFGGSKCWFDGPLETWTYFYAPVFLLLLCNIVFFIWSGWRLWQDYSHIQVEGKLRSLRYKCMLYLKLLLFMGLTWIFELISYIADDAPFFWYCTDVLNCLQGVIIFLLVVVFRKKVVRALVKHKPWGVKVPTKWAKGQDDESEAILADEELSHTQVA